MNIFGMIKNLHVEGGTLIKWEQAGHEFHGNQYTDGAGAGSKTAVYDAAHNASQLAIAASDKAFSANGNKDDHKAAVVAHQEAADKWGKLGNTQRSATHASMASSHMSIWARGK